MLREPAGNPKSAWALAHGLLAFGKDFAARDGRPAVQVVAAFAEPRDLPGRRVYAFALQKDGEPIEPHLFLLTKTLLEVGVPLSAKLRAGDGAELTLQRLVDDMKLQARMPTDDASFHEAAWLLSALELEAAARPGAHSPVALPALREAALLRLEADDAIFSDAAAPNAFAPERPMGAAKRGKTHIYGHACGGLHLVQAVLRAAAADGSDAFVTRVRAQLRLLLLRTAAERALYAQSLGSHPQAALPLRAQQLKFFGHVLETLVLAVELRLLAGDATLAEAAAAERSRLRAELDEVIAYLRAQELYARLPQLAATQRQLALDLVGDGCHALHALRGEARLPQ